MDLEGASEREKPFRALRIAFGSTLNRHVAISIAPTLALVVIAVYLNSWKTKEIRTTTSTIVKVGTQTLASNVDSFFSDKMLFVNHMRQLIREGIWTDVTDMDTYAEQVIPILTHHTEYQGLYMRLQDGTMVLAHKPNYTQSGLTVVDLSISLPPIASGMQASYVRQHLLNFSGTTSRWTDWQLLNYQIVQNSAAGVMYQATWFLQASAQPVQSGATSNLHPRVPYWGPPVESGSVYSIFLALRIDWPYVRDPANVANEYTTFRFQFDPTDMNTLLLAELPNGIEAVIVNVGVSPTAANYYVMYSVEADGIVKSPSINFGKFVGNPSAAYGQIYTQSFVQNNVTYTYSASPIGKPNDGLFYWHVVTFNVQGGTYNEITTILQRVQNVFARLVTLGSFAQYAIQSRLLDDPEDISAFEKIMIPNFMANPIVTNMYVVHGTNSFALMFTRTSLYCDVTVYYYTTTPFLSRRYTVGPSALLRNWVVLPSGGIVPPQWFVSAPYLQTDDQVFWSTPVVDTDLCSSPDISQCLSPAIVQDALTVPLFFQVSWPYPHNLNPSAGLDHSLFAFTFALSDLHQVLVNLGLDQIGGGAAVFQTQTRLVVVSSTELILTQAQQSQQRLESLPVFSQVTFSVLNQSINSLGTDVYIDNNDWYLQVITLPSNPGYSVIFLVQQTVKGTQTFSRSEYYIDGLIAAVVICFVLHVCYVLLHVSDVKRIAKMISDVADMRLDLVEPSNMSFSCASELRRMQHSTLRLRETMERLKPYLGPIRNLATEDLSVEMNRVSIRQGCSVRNLCVLSMSHVTHSGIAAPCAESLEQWEKVIVDNGGRSYMMDGNLYGLWEVTARPQAICALMSLPPNASASGGIVLATIACGNVMLGNVGGDSGRTFTLVGAMVDDIQLLREYAYDVLLFDAHGQPITNNTLIALVPERFGVPMDEIPQRRLGNVICATPCEGSGGKWAVFQVMRERRSVQLAPNDMSHVIDFLNQGNHDKAEEALQGMHLSDVEWERAFQQKLQMCVQRRSTGPIDMER